MNPLPSNHEKNENNNDGKTENQGASFDPSIRPDHSLWRLFAGLTENVFFNEMGIIDPPLIDYVTHLLIRFLHMSELYRLKDSQNKSIKEVPDMVREAESLPSEGRTRREYHRHIGDYTLFWLGLFPEMVQRKMSNWSRDTAISYVAIGKRSYLIASTFQNSPFTEESLILHRLSLAFEGCALGLNYVRKELDHLPPLVNKGNQKIIESE